jgi:hypothetical protein
LDNNETEIDVGGEEENNKEIESGEEDEAETNSLTSSRQIESGEEDEAETNSLTTSRQREQAGALQVAVHLAEEPVAAAKDTESIGDDEEEDGEAEGGQDEAVQHSAQWDNPQDATAEIVSQSSSAARPPISFLRKNITNEEKRGRTV